jgi:hypothetical protein
MSTRVVNDDQATTFVVALSAVVGLGMAFQVGHFAEHAVQFSVWLTGKYQWVVDNFCGRDTPFMSGPVTDLVQYIGGLCAGAGAPAARKGLLGVELLHLIGNSIFLATIFGAHYLWRSKWTRWALYVEGFHLCEHLALTLTAFYVGKPIGLSTAFGQAGLWWGKEAAVGYRVSWHFAMNLLPMPLVMVGMMEHWPEMMRSMFPRLSRAR